MLWTCLQIWMVFVNGCKCLCWMSYLIMHTPGWVAGWWAGGRAGRRAIWLAGILCRYWINQSMYNQLPRQWLPVWNPQLPSYCADSVITYKVRSTENNSEYLQCMVMMIQKHENMKKYSGTLSGLGYRHHITNLMKMNVSSMQMCKLGWPVILSKEQC